MKTKGKNIMLVTSVKIRVNQICSSKSMLVLKEEKN